ncbi:putative adenylyl-sulfate kinase [bioreactor metagenome]|jgi:adenylylsulfate kinase|uniref:adenylyl-sulfate kinase n=1 Tax=bioreactor metagenome TaxID=1076179 RepID=A0A644UCR7_9ZZZZ|nr:adenylyl-sulfate kinase [Lentimicrobium sp.]MEA5111897.1 adenylyl-sulfate kinase [Lentimicrobium sp.]HCT69984.1 adenylyl-sulfate kinase [Bacteroidales bacterium]
MNGTGYRQTIEKRLGQKARVIWLTGLPCSGKTTLGAGLEKALLDKGFHVRLLDGDVTRRGLCSDLGFSVSDREENIRRVAEISKLFVESGIITINAFITPTERLRKLAIDIIGSDNLVSVYVNAPVEVCEARDVKGMYRKARRGDIPDFTGVSAPFEIPLNPDYKIDTTSRTPQQNIAELLEFIIPKIKFEA